mmetsp:Transcript_24126/g.47386  ORF Transcript_24126/g.47386 Transcript_24126/m.47386 type:complete len:232 (-) Transcript_24126:162-857(-)
MHHGRLSPCPSRCLLIPLLPSRAQERLLPLLYLYLSVHHHKGVLLVLVLRLQFSLPPLVLLLLARAVGVGVIVVVPVLVLLILPVTAIAVTIAVITVIMTGSEVSPDGAPGLAMSPARAVRATLQLSCGRADAVVAAVEPDLAANLAGSGLRSGGVNDGAVRGRSRRACGRWMCRPRAMGRAGSGSPPPVLPSFAPREASCLRRIRCGDVFGCNTSNSEENDKPQELHCDG